MATREPQNEEPWPQPAIGEEGELDGRTRRKGGIDRIDPNVPAESLEPEVSYIGRQARHGAAEAYAVYLPTRPYPEYTATAPAMGSCPAGRDIRKVPTSPKDKYVPPMRKLADYMLSLVSQATRSLPATALGKKPFI